MTEQWKKRVYKRRIKNFLSKEDWHKLRMECLNRDRFTCQRCQKNNRQGMEAHHIQPRDQGGADAVENLITLCTKCHDIVEIAGCKSIADIIACDELPIKEKKLKPENGREESFDRPEWHKYVYGGARKTQ